MKKKILGIISFSVTVAVLVLTLKFMNLLPALIDKGTMRQYASVEAVGATLDMREILVPSYFPEPLGWPPSKILAQKVPFEAVVMEFARSGDDTTVLVITQAERPEFANDTKLRLINISEIVSYDLGEEAALLETGVCVDRQPCSRISWDEKGKHISLSMRSQPIELIKIAESMSH